MQSSFSRNLVLILALASGSAAFAQSHGEPVWVTTHPDPTAETSPGSGETWEDRYSHCIGDPEKVNETTFIAGDSALKGVAADCAKAAEALQIYCSYQNGLPFALPAAQKLSKQTPRILLSNENTGEKFFTSKYSCTATSQKSSCDARFRDFVRMALASGVSTTTVSRDTFPVSINSKYLTPGKILLYFSSQNKNSIRHTHTLTEMNSNGVPSLLSATENNKPQELANLMRIEIPPSTDGEDGLRGWRHYRFNPQTRTYSIIPLSEEPGSEEYARIHDAEGYVSQYNRNLFPREDWKWGDAITKKIGGDLTPADEIEGLVDSVCDSVHRRESKVEEGNRHFADKHCANSAEWEYYSTESLDAGIWRKFEKIDEVVRRFKPGQPEGDEKSFESARQKRDEGFQSCHLGKFDPTLDTRLDLRWIRLAFKSRAASADPSDSTTAQRWGLFNNFNIDLDGDPTPRGLNAEDPTTYDTTHVISYNSCRGSQGISYSIPTNLYSGGSQKSVNSPSALSNAPAPIPTSAPAKPKVPNIPQVKNDPNAWQMLLDHSNGRQN